MRSRLTHVKSATHALDVAQNQMSLCRSQAHAHTHKYARTHSRISLQLTKNLSDFMRVSSACEIFQSPVSAHFVNDKKTPQTFE